VEIVKELVAEMWHDLAEHRRQLMVVASTVAVVVLAGTIAALAGSAIAVMAIAGTAMFGTALAVLVVTAFMRT
jgi:hypothetical protein